MTADQLQAALDEEQRSNLEQRMVDTAARFWLNLLEADETTVERVAQAIYVGDPIYKPPYWEDCTPDMKVWYRSTARKVLAAIVGEET